MSLEPAKAEMILICEALGERLIFELVPETTSSDYPIQFTEGNIPGGENIQHFISLGTRRVSFNIFLCDQGAYVKKRQYGAYRDVLETIELLKAFRQPLKLGEFAGSPPVLEIFYASDISGKYYLDTFQVQVLQRSPDGTPIRATIALGFRKYVRSPI